MALKIFAFMKIISYLFLCFIIFQGLKAQPIVNTQYGQVQGVMNGSVYQFLGIPYAKPPVGNLRWKAPENPSPWTGILNADNFKPACPQKDFKLDGSSVIKGEEDCLYLNIWTPQLGSAQKAVMVFIHGGGNQLGSASDTSGGTLIYFGKNLSERGDVVVVTIQYRLGPLGFLVHPGLDAESPNGKSGNYAVLDQILALQWIKNNISNFGGDTSRIMIFGESAGGMNVGNLMLTPLSAGLFHKACIQSASPFIQDYAEAQNNGIAFVDSFIDTGTVAQKIAYMRTLPADSLLYFLESPLQNGIVSSPWKAVKDSVIFFEFAHEALKNGNFHKVPLIIGSNADEMSIFAPQTVTPAMVTALIIAYVPLALRPLAMALYPPGNNNAEARQSYVAILTDAQFTAPARRVAQCVSINSPEPVWRYFFNHRHTVSILESYGAYHGMELFYVFNNWENATLGQGALFKPADDSVQKIMLGYWTNFAKYGNPNGPNLPNWASYHASTDCYIELKATPAPSHCGLRTDRCDLWDAAINYIPCSLSTSSQKPFSGNSFRVFPNPFSSDLTIQSQNTVLRLNIFNLLGNQVYTETVDNQEIKIQLNFLQNGMYFMELEYENGKTESIKIIKLKD